VLLTDEDLERLPSGARTRACDEATDDRSGMGTLGQR
jgi:hypothetical protein